MEKFSHETKEAREGTPYDLGVIFRVEGEAKKETNRLVGLIENRVKLVSRVDESRLPHISLFQGRMPGVPDIAQLERVIAELFKESKFNKIEMDSNLFIRPNGNIFWNATPNNNLSELHLKLLEKLHPLTKGLLMEQFKSILGKDETSDSDREQIEKYGSLLAGPTFLPHITLGRLENIGDKKLIEDIKPELTYFHLAEPVIAELNQDGSLKSASM